MAGKGNQQQSLMTVDQQGSPAPKRKVPDPENLALSIDVIREAIRGELKDAMTDLKQEMWRMSKRVDQVEGQVTKQMQQTINMLDEITVKHAAQGEVLQQLQEANREVTGSSAWRRRGGRFFHSGQHNGPWGDTAQAGTDHWRMGSRPGH